jgi:PIN domain nuclease of toxin-antitoxin system
MRLLLDTHIFLWSHLDPERLTRRVVAALSSDQNELWLSPITSWEVLLLAERGLVTLNGDADAWLDHALDAVPMHEAPITHAIARASRALELPHGDPADRVLAATAKELDLTLVTADQRLMESRQFAVLANR